MREGNGEEVLRRIVRKVVWERVGKDGGGELGGVEWGGYGGGRVELFDER